MPMRFFLGRKVFPKLHSPQQDLRCLLSIFEGRRSIMAKLNPLVKIRLRNVLALVLDKPILCSVQDIDQLLERRPELANCRQAITLACEALLSCFRSGNQVLLCGNGGSAADCEHIAGEFVKRFSRPRPLDPLLAEKLGSDLASHLHGALPALSLPSMVGFTTAFVNDDEPEYAFAQQVVAFGKPSDLLLAISTSGNSQKRRPCSQSRQSTGPQDDWLDRTRRRAAWLDLRNHDPSSRQRGSAGTGAPSPRLPHPLSSRGRHPFPLSMNSPKDLREKLPANLSSLAFELAALISSQGGRAYSRWQCETCLLGRTPKNWILKFAD